MQFSLEDLKKLNTEGHRLSKQLEEISRCLDTYQGNLRECIGVSEKIKNAFELYKELVEEFDALNGRA